MILMRNALADGQTSFERGVDTDRAPIRVPRNQCCLLVNQTTREDYLDPRPGWRQVPLQFVAFNEETGKYTHDPALQASFEDGYFQGFNGYVPDTGASELIFSISGKVFRVDPLGNQTVQALKMPDGDNPPRRPLVWFVQGELFLVIQDGQSVPLIYDGASLRRSDVRGVGGQDADGHPLVEVPVGTCMAYSDGRLWIALPDGMHFIAGDLVYDPTGTAQYNRRDAILRFTSNQYLNGGFPFAVPANKGPIRALVPLANLDTSLGQGPLQVFTVSCAFSVSAPTDRDLWFNLKTPIKTVSLLDQGALSQRGAILVNSDVWYRSLDGWRSFMIARRDFGTWGNLAKSREVIRHLKNDDVYLLDRQSAALFSQRALCTCDPQVDQLHGVYHRGLVALDFAPLTSIGSIEQPVWDGLWTGPHILQIQTVQSQGVDHCYAAVLAPADEDGNRKIQLWELSTFERRDTSLTAKGRIRRVSESPSLDFQNRLEQKCLEGAEIWYDKIFGTVDITLYYRPNEHACWFFWKSWTVCSKNERCVGDSIAGCQPSLNLRRQFRCRVGAMRPPDNVVPGTNEASRLGYTFQYRLEVIGDMEVTAVKLLANKVVEASFGAPGDETCSEVICCDLPDTPPEPIPPTDTIVGIVEENEDIWIDREDEDTIIRTEGQPQFGTPVIPGGPGTTDPGDGGTNPPSVDPNVPPNLPQWPIPPAYGCPGEQTTLPIMIVDPIRGLSRFPGIYPPAGFSPNDWIAFIGAPGALEAWSQAVWADFLASGIPFSQARLIWADIPTTGDWLATNVFPDELGNYPIVIDMITKVVVQWCPP